jgi:hypothetical protein
MTPRPIPFRVLRLAIVLAVLFNLLALLVMLHATPIVFTLFMFGAQPVFLVAIILLVAAVLADLRSKNLL